MRPLRILTWHVHGSYLYYLVQSCHEFYLPVKPGYPEGYGGRLGDSSWPINVHDVPAEETYEDIRVGSSFEQVVRNLELVLEARRQLGSVSGISGDRSSRPHIHLVEEDQERIEH